MNAVERAKRLILQPRQEWSVIADEPFSVQELYTRYVMILAAIGPIAAFIGNSIVGIGGLGVRYRVPIGAGIAHMVLSYILALGSVYVLALVIEWAAPKFGGKSDFMQAMKVASFAPTAAWLAGVFAIVPLLGVLGMLLGLYSLYLLYLGLPQLMQVAEDKAVPYLFLIIIAVVLIAVAMTIVASLAIPSPLRGF
jgi:hypothetical protein